MTGLNIAHRRLLNQHLVGNSFEKPADVVRWLGAVQAQDYLGALWAVGLRTQNATEQAIEQAIADRTIIRTWPMRGTLHFVAPEDARWMLALLTPRVIANSARRHRQLELDDEIFARSKALLAKALQGGRQLTRPEMMGVLEQAGIATQNQRGYHILFWLAQMGFICFGPRRGKQHIFVLLDEWAPEGKSLTRDESLAELARRYFTGHGPATVQDFMWWTGLMAADARASLEMVKSELAHEVIDGQTYWFSSSAPDAGEASPTSPTVHLLPGFDEYLLGYKDRSAALDPAYARQVVPGGNGMFSPTIAIDGCIVGTWKRTFKKDRVVISLNLFNGLSDANREAIAGAAERYRAFVDAPAVVFS